MHPRSGRADLREALVQAARSLYERGYALATLGSLSVRHDAQSFLLLPDTLPKDQLDPASLQLVPLAGSPLSGEACARLHRAAYLGRPAARAVIHCHPVSVMACSLVGMDWDKPLLPEAVLGVGPIARLPAWYPGCPPIEAELRRAVAGHAAVIFARGGVLTAGPDLAETLYLIERVDQVAQVFVKSAQLGRIRTLPPDEVARLEAMRGA